MALKKQEIDALRWNPEGPSQQITWDKDTVPGFGVRVYPSGKKSYVLSYRSKRRARLMVVASCHVLTVSEARKKARRYLANVLEGTDPLEVKRSGEKNIRSVRVLADAWIERHAKLHRRSWKGDRRRLKKWILPALGSRAPENVATADVATLHATIGKTAKVEANRVVELLRAIYGWGLRTGLLARSVRNPAAAVDRFREASRERWLREEELKALADQIQAEKDPFIRAALWLYLLVPVRKRELLGARWEDVDFERGELTLPRTKAGRPHVIPLPGPALTILEDLPHVKGNPHVFPGRKGKPRTDIRRAWLRVREGAGLQDVRLHDLRRTAGSWMAQAGVSLQVIGELLNHRHPAVTRVYARLASEQPRKALDEYAAKVMKAAGNGTTPQKPAESGADPTALATTLRALADLLEGKKEG